MRALLLLALVSLAVGCVATTPGATEPGAEAAASLDRDCLRVVRGVDLQAATIPDLQRALDAGEITSVELVDAYLARFAAYDEAGPKLNSVQTMAPDAREQAAALDAERAAGNVRGPLHGIPILLKDNVGTIDMPTTAGSIALAQNVPNEEATLTLRLREAGAIILGKTQLSEFANWVSLNMPNGYSSLGGQVVNAYTGGDPSGSSSGSGVAGSMALAAATIGTETSGSILSPSNANSLVGVKPTLGLVSRAGVIPLAASFDTPGPMTRRVVDAAIVLGAIAGPDERDAATGPSQGALPADGDYAALLEDASLAGVRLGYEPNDDPLFQAALEALEAQGAQLVPMETDNKQFVSITELGLIFNEFKAGINAYIANEAGPGLPVTDLTGIIAYNQQNPDKIKYGQDLLIASDAQAGIGAPFADAAAIPTIMSSRAAADEMFATYDLDAAVGLDAPYTSLGAAAGYPTVTVPAGYDGDGVEPHGLSFFGPAWSEPTLLQYAYAYEQATMMREAPTVINEKLTEGVCG